jgi:hypothetical protein
LRPDRPQRVSPKHISKFGFRKPGTAIDACREFDKEVFAQLALADPEKLTRSSRMITVKFPSVMDAITREDPRLAIESEYDRQAVVVSDRFCDSICLPSHRETSRVINKIGLALVNTNKSL